MSESSKDKIVKAATKIFSEKGYEGASIREIAALADMNVASINYHFVSKKNLMDFLLEDFVNNKLSPVLLALDPPESFDEFKIRMDLFIKQFLNMIIKEYDSFLMLQKNLDAMIRISPTSFKTSFQGVHNCFLKFITQGIKKNILKSDLSPEIATQIFFSCFFDLVKTNEARKQLGITFFEDKNFIEKYAKTYSTIFFKGMEVEH